MTVRTLTARPPAVGPVRHPGGWGWWVAAGIALLPADSSDFSLLFQVIGTGTTLDGAPARLAELMFNTVVLTVAVTVTAVVIGLTTAWTTTKYPSSTQGLDDARRLSLVVPLRM